MNLFIDTHFNNVILLLEKNKEIVSKEVIINQKNNSTILMPSIKKLLNNQIPDSIIVVNGPGSFTGVRLGVTVAKTLAYTMNIPIRTITSLECMSYFVNKPNAKIGFSDSNGYYIGNFNYNTLVGDIVYIDNKDYNNDSIIIDNDYFDDLVYVNIINDTLNRKPINPHAVNPIYIKKINVEKNDTIS